MMIPAASLEYLLVPVSGPPGVDVTTFLVDLALVALGREPAAGDWHAGAWIGGEAALLVGPTAQVYQPGDYMCWARLTAGAEKPVMKAGRVRIGDMAT